VKQYSLQFTDGRCDWIRKR